MFNKKEEKVIPNLEEKLLLRAAIDKAEENGYKAHLRHLPTFVHQIGDKKAKKADLDSAANEIFYFHGREIVFSIEFIKAFFPANEVDKERNVIKDYKYHRAEMYKTNPIKYIEKYL